ncbi:MAG: DsbA family protein [Acidobacteriota bacterium]
MNKRFLSLIITATIIAIVSATNTTAQVKRKTKVPAKTGEISKPEREAIENVVREYLIKNPLVVREAMMALQAQEEKQKRETTAANMKLLRSEIYSDADSPVTGNAKGDVTVVVFFDYFCGYCKKTMPGLQTLLANDSSLRIVYKEFPILGAQSLSAARAALAASRQGKYAEFHQALLAAAGAGEDLIKAVSEGLNLDYAKLQKDMSDPKISAALERNIRLAELLNINGTPTYLVGDQLIPGALDSDSLARLIKAERAKSTSSEIENSRAPTKGAN